MTHSENQEILAFFNTNDLPCPACNAESWELLNPDEPLLYIMGTQDGAVQTPSAYIPCYGLICIQCGYIRTHSKIMVDRRIATQKKANA